MVMLSPDIFKNNYTEIRNATSTPPGAEVSPRCLAGTGSVTSVEEASKGAVCLSCVIYSNVVAGGGCQLIDPLHRLWLFPHFSA